MKDASVVVADGVTVGEAGNVAEDSVELVGHEAAQLDAVRVLVLYDLVADVFIEILKERSRHVKSFRLECLDPCIT